LIFNCYSVFTSPPASLPGVVSGVESASVGVLPAVSSAAAISAMFTIGPPAKVGSTVKIISTVVEVPANVVVAVAPAAAHNGSAALNVKPAGI